MEVAEGVRAVQVPSDNVMMPQSTNIYLVGGDQTLTIDSGEALDKYQWMLRGYLAAVEKTEIAIAAITHHHFDHSGNLKWAKEIFEAEVAIPDNARPLLKGRLPSKGVRKLADGEVLDMGKGSRVRVLRSPGHSVDSICYYMEESGVLFTGDTILGGTTTVVHDLPEYRATLQRLVELPNLKVICPGHGPLIENPRERLQEYIDHRNMREAQILAELEEGEALSSWEIMLRLYPDVHPQLRRAATGNVEAHLEQLKTEGRVAEHGGTPRKPSARKVAAMEKKEKEHAKVIRHAKKLEGRLRAALFASQEGPPDEKWIEPPRYEKK